MRFVIMTLSSLGDRDELPDPGSKTTWVPTLNIDHAGPVEPADEPFTGCETGDPSCGGSLNIV